MSVRIAWERHGSGAPLLLIHGLGYARWGWEPVLPGARRAVRRDPLRQPRHRRERRAAGPVHGRARWPATRCRCSTRPASSGRTSSARASAGWSRRSSRSRTPSASTGSCSRARRRAGRSAHPMPRGTLALMAEAATLEPAVALRRFVENALAPATVAARPELVERIMAHRLATAQASGRLGGAGGGRRGVRRLRPARRARRADARPARRRGRRRRPAERRAARRAPPATRASSSFPGAGHLFFWEQPDAVRRVGRASFLEGA